MGQKERGDGTEGSDRMTIQSKGRVRVEMKVSLLKDKREKAWMDEEEKSSEK